MTPQVVGRAHAAKQMVGACPVEPRIVINHVTRQGRIIVPHARGECIEVRSCDITARQRRISRPGAGHGAEIRLQPLERMLRQFAKGRDLAAEYRQNRRRAIDVVEFENIVARDGRRILGIVVEQRPDARKRMDDVGARELAHAIAIDGAKQIGNLVFTGRDVIGLAAVGDVRGPDQAEITLIGIDENHPAIVILKQIGLRSRPRTSAPRCGCP